MGPSVPQESQQLVCVCANEVCTDLADLHSGGLLLTRVRPSNYSRQAGHQRRAAADRGEHRQAAGILRSQRLVAVFVLNTDYA
jgi:hypothetical protein